VSIRGSVWGPAPELRPSAAGGAGDPVASSAPIVFDGAPLESAILRGELPPGTRISGPALCALSESTLLVPPGFSGVVDEHGTCHLEEQR
jgi:hypothetical protein